MTSNFTVASSSQTMGKAAGSPLRRPPPATPSPSTLSEQLEGHPGIDVEPEPTEEASAKKVRFGDTTRMAYDPKNIMVDSTGKVWKAFPEEPPPIKAAQQASGSPSQNTSSRGSAAPIAPPKKLSTEPPSTSAYVPRAGEIKSAALGNRFVQAVLSEGPRMAPPET